MADEGDTKTRKHGERTPTRKVACLRCGIFRLPNRTGLCGDCYGSMTAEERNLWKEQK